MKKTLLIFGLALCVTPLFTSCDLDEVSPQDLQSAGTTLNANTNAELGVIKVFENVNNFGFGAEGLKAAELSGSQPTASWNGNTLTLDFTGVENASGKIYATFSGTPGYVPGLTTNVTFDNYVNNGSGLDGEMLMKLEEFTLAEKAVFSFKSVGNIEVTEGDDSFLWTCDQTFDWAEGLFTLTDGSDDTFILNGTSTQTVDTLVNKMKLTDVVYATACDFIKDGVIELTQDSGSADELIVTCDFGIDANGNDAGDCDGYVKMTAGGITLTIDMESY
ncbi:MAG TPA: hypothetical protein DCQ26_01380 [Marinilabiliales bacterium]|jgi:hypothetical protein|nr:MAG: hypothetical protein A2W95_17135 [Bacteroidetes bacterium GWA2_40_14]OFX61281.1 MAG: hypothetical protein A2W84_14305 [Bacteroidetes bacterium GWC2_40_13]OFX72998.1 MAG: hypothetical protein A2W96_18980 [Bacteroidetes bacterium GWD2_40_43]OFX92628.1 MAG: hypothetical protein A2W97_08980 [Bacteroidetes bacterium GWE2_40_63]OFY17485.1 MAG: hypothetical protein A2W88_13740 [Bacteroidetes bacterium GWF2_40_13]OFZ27582.1 MAG: hypothetical protein A2437_15065 [Bacteroidetes bacterium RIFOXYC